VALIVFEPRWRPGDRVIWNGYAGSFLRETSDGYAEVLIGRRTYRGRKIDLQSAQRYPWSGYNAALVAVAAAR
jgi:hypothetical protein